MFSRLLRLAERYVQAIEQNTAAVQSQTESMNKHIQALEKNATVTASQQQSIENFIKSVESSAEIHKDIQDNINLIQAEHANLAGQKPEPDPLINAGNKASAINAIGALAATTVAIVTASHEPPYQDSPTGNASANEGLS